MLRILLLLMTALITVLLVLHDWLTTVVATFDMVVMAAKRLWLGLRLVISSLVGATPPWANRSLLNYVRILAARYSPLNTALVLVDNTDVIIGTSYTGVDNYMSHTIELSRWDSATLTL